MKRILILTLALVLLLGLAATPVMAAKPGGNQEALLDAITKGADLHLSRQGTYSEVDNTWEWVIGSGSGGANIQGISATGLLAAYERTGNTDYLDGAIAAGDTLVERYEAAPNQRPFSQDIEFLVRLSQDSGDNSYVSVAKQWYNNTTSGFSAEGLVAWYIDNSLYAPWDLASQIRAAVAVGKIGYATSIAAELIEREDDWEAPYLGGWDYGSLLWAFDALGGNSFKGYVGETKETLLNTQGSGGSWDNDFQSTAYAMLGLSAIQGKNSKDALAKAWGYLRDAQTTDGGWSYPPEIGEINSEVIMALSVLKVDEGLHKGKTDPQPDHGKDTGRHPLDPSS